jgi:single-stranded-DNA-specific exonuclease
MTAVWIEPEDIVVPENLNKFLCTHPLVIKTLVRRGFNTPEKIQAFFYPECYSPTPATELPGIELAVSRIIRAIELGETILVWGDFDVDGQTSTTLLVEALRDLSAKVTYHIPIRSIEGHGIQVNVLQKKLTEYSNVRLLLTCDTGISAHDAISFAKNNGVDVIITDHHDLPDKLPSAYAIVNPKLLDQHHSLATLPGVGVVFKLVEALVTKISPHSANQLTTDKYLDLVALGIIADLAEQRKDTRYLLQKGIFKLQNTNRQALQSLYEIAKIPGQLNEDHIGFGLAPRLNALGRLSDANPVVDFLTTEDNIFARRFASQLEGLNERRKLLTEQVYQACIRQIDQGSPVDEQAALVLAYPGWHTGVIGIVASKLVEKFGKPTILLSIGDDGIARGSARSIDGIHITNLISSQKELLIKYGGHSGAAGLSLPEDAIHQFRRGIIRAIRTKYGDQIPERFINIDAYTLFSDITLDIADEISKLGPFGSGNPPIHLASRNLQIINFAKIGRRKNHYRLVLSDDFANTHEVVWWNGVGSSMPEVNVPFDLVYKIHSVSYQGKKQLQIEWVDFRSDAEIILEKEITESSIGVFDYRSDKNPLSILTKILTNENIQIWAEGEAKQRIGGSDRNELEPDKDLAVWTTPASNIEWKFVLDYVKPKNIYLFAIDPKMDEYKVFLTRLAGLIKFLLRTKNGEGRLELLAAATSQTENTIRMGLLWLEAKGMIKILHREENNFQLTSGSGSEKSDLAELTNDLKSLLSETAAYRQHFKTTDIFATK